MSYKKKKTHCLNVALKTNSQVSVYDCITELIIERYAPFYADDIHSVQ